MQQQPTSSSKSGPPNLVSTEQIQKYLEENRNLILAILEHQNNGKVAECGQLQAVLQKNLMNLAAIADAQPPPSGPSQVQPPNSAAQQGNYMQQQSQGLTSQQQSQGLTSQQQSQGLMSQQQSQGLMSQQQQGGGVSKLPKPNAVRSQDQQQQLLHYQQQQQMYGQMAMRPGSNNGMHGMHQMLQHGMGNSGGLIDARAIKQDVSEVASGDGQGKFVSGRGNRES